jgi:hypothetical protein
MVASRWADGGEVDLDAECRRLTARISIASKTAVRVKTMAVSRVARNQYVKAVETPRR